MFYESAKMFYISSARFFKIYVYMLTPSGALHMWPGGADGIYCQQLIFLSLKANIFDASSSRLKNKMS